MYRRFTSISTSKSIICFIFALWSSLFSNVAIAQTCNTDLTNGIAPASITASAENAPGEGKDKAFDNIFTSKWYAGVKPSVATPVYIQVDLGTAKIVTNYSITSANDVPARDPKDFQLLGSNNGSTFTALHTISNEVFATRLLTKYYSFSNNTAYRYYRLSITANNGNNSVTATQLAEIQLLPTAECIVGNVYNNTVGVGYAGVPVLLRNISGGVANTTASTTTDANGHFVFTTAQAPQNDYAAIVQPPASTYFYSGPVANLNASVMSTQILNYFQEGMFPTGSFLNVSGDINAVTTNYYLIDNSEGVKTPPSFDWVLKQSPINAPICPKVSTTLDGNGTFGNLTTTEYINEHAWQPGFHSGPFVFATEESHPNLFRPVTSGTSGYINGNILYSNRGSLFDEGRYNVTSFLGTIQDAALIFGRLATGADVNSTFSLVNGHNGGWRKTYGRTTGDPYDLFLAANGQTTGSGSIIEFTANITSTGTKYLNFYGKNANSFVQAVTGAYPNVEILFSVFNSTNTLVTSTLLNLSPVTSAAQDEPTSPWEGRTFTFTAATTGTYTFKLSVPTTSQKGNDFYLDNIELSECPIQFVLTGTVWDDANGNLLQSGGESGTNAGNTLYVNLVDADGNVVTSVLVNADGTYSMPIPQTVTGYSLVLTDDPSLNTPHLPSGWINTGENVNSTDNTATQTSTTGVIQLNTLTSNITGQNFGIEQLPNSDPKSQFVPYPTGGIIPAGIVTTAVSGTDPEDGVLGNNNTIVITSLPTNATMFYNGVPVTVGQTITNFNPALLSFTGITNGSTQVVFQYAFVDAAGQQDPSPATYTLTWANLSPLPIRLESFTIKASQCDKVELNWKVSDAVDFSHFEIERSVNGADFHTAGLVFFDANYTTYQFKESNLAKANYQYRVKLVDKDGKVKYSTVVFTRLNCGQQQILVYPNPARDKVTINGMNGSEQILLYNGLGQVLQSRKAVAYQENLNISTLSTGMYYLTIVDKAGITIYETKIVKSN